MRPEAVQIETFIRSRFRSAIGSKPLAMDTALFSSGIVDSRRLVFYGTLTCVPLYFTVRVVDAWRWG